jgi:2-methylcitrate dehydratase PrpD
MSTVVKPVEFKHAGPAGEPTVAEKLAAFAAGFDLAQAPKEIVELAKLHVLDCFGIALASTTMDYGQRALTAAREIAGQGESPVIGTPVRLPLRDAAMVNGTLVHGLDFDDTHTTGIFHCSASAVPTMFAMALARGKSGAEALGAYLMAIEAGTRIAKAARGGLHRTGFHTTAVVGAYASALLAGRLSDLPESQLADAQGLALSMAGGTREYHTSGSWSKRIHPGLAAANGITAAAWAKHGYTGPHSCYEGQYGLYNCNGNRLEVDPEDCTAGLGEAWEINNVAFKPYPACHWNHAFADATLKLREEHGLQPDDVESITALVHKDQLAVVAPEERKRRPHDSYAAQFSVHYIIAATLMRGRFTLAEIDPESFTDPDILAICDRTKFDVTDETLFPRYFSGTVIMRTGDGRELKHYQKHNLGSDGNPITGDQVKQKFLDNAARATSPRRAQRVFDAVMDMENAPDLGALAEAVSLS